jgi:hypothetical protein
MRATSHVCITPEADMCSALGHACFGPKADIRELICATEKISAYRRYPPTISGTENY